MLQPKAEAGSDIAAIGNDGSKIRSDNRWPREETMALLQIRSDMDGVFRDSSHKAPLWDQVSRKMAEMGYSRSSKKCKEKFENVNKYHRRTKDGRSAKSDGKTYQFFDQLEALQAANHSSSSSFLPPEAATAVPISMAMPPPRPSLITPIQPAPINFHGGTPSSSSSTSSDEEIIRRKSRRKRKWKEFFEKLTKEVISKQEEIERKFLEAMQRKENERKVREESWRITEIARLKQEREILIKEKSMASAKEAALISYLQNLSDNHQIPLPTAILQPHPPSQILVIPISKPVQENRATTVNSAQMPVNGVSFSSPSRWPKEVAEALIKLRANLDHKFQQEKVLKMELWEEISGLLRKMG